MKIKSEIIEALRNYSYRCVGQKDDIIVFAKPLGYSLIYANIIQDNKETKLEMSLIVKGTDGENMVYISETNTLEDIKNNEEYYLNVVQIIMDFETSITIECCTWSINRDKRFDFRENTKCLNELYW